MSQFLLLANPDISRLPGWVKVHNVKDDPFFSQVGEVLFSELETSVFAIVKSDGKDFDDMFVSAQRDLLDGKSLSDTLLYRTIAAIDSNVDAMALWYGNDYEGLEKVSDIQSVINEIRRGLSEPSAEAYALFVRN